MVYVAVDYVDHGLPEWSLEALLGALRLSAVAGKDVMAVLVSPGPGPGPDELDALGASLSAYGVKSANLVAAEGYAPMVVEPLVERLAPVVRGLPPVTQLATGSHHACVLSAFDGVVLCWGMNGDGALGDATLVDRHLPVRVRGLRDRVLPPSRLVRSFICG